MAIELKFSKSDNGTPWGFRLVGGADFDQPLVVVKVNKNSLAEQAGLEVGDLVVRINDTSTAGLTHAESHELLSSVGLEFVVAVRRGVFSSQIVGSDDYENEFEKLVQDIEESMEQNIIEEAVDRINRIEAENLKNLEISLSENLAGQEEMLYITESPHPRTFAETLTHGIKTDKKWSTFLMKPDKPVPKLKKKVEEQPKGEGYKVVITKQRGQRPYMAQQQKKVQFNQNVIQVELPADDEEEIFNDESDEIEETTHDLVDSKEETDEDQQRDSPEETENVNEGCENDESDNSENNQDFDDSLEKEFEIIEFKPLSEIRIESESETSTTLEEQLRAVQKQLQALSELPSAVQVTLDAVSRQLATLVGEKENVEEKETEAYNVTEKETEEGDGDAASNAEEYHEEGSVSEKAQAEINQGEFADTNSSFGEDLEEDIITDEIKEIIERSEKMDDNENEVVEGPTQEELEARILEEERLAKQQKASEERPQRMERPIVLPGGRKWIDPDDVVPKRKSKMTDQEMTEAIDSSLEVIAGKRKGINFLKYDPPAKNLEFLQHSETYRLIHGMDTETRGITVRPETVPAVQDYYEATQRGPP